MANMKRLLEQIQEAAESIKYGFCGICKAKHEFPNVKCDLMNADEESL